MSLERKFVEVSGIDPFLSVLSQHKKGIVVVYFYATWCKPCKKMFPLIKYLKGIDIVIKVNIDDDRKHRIDERASEIYGVTTYPTILSFVDGVKSGVKIEGYKGKEFMEAIHELRYSTKKIDSTNTQIDV
jgi:thiol-disulfide isomerase/thioredoxin